MFLSRCVKVVPFFNGRYTKGAPFLSKMLYKRVIGWTSGLSSSPKGRSGYLTPIATEGSHRFQRLRTVPPFVTAHTFCASLVSFEVSKFLKKFAY